MVVGVGGSEVRQGVVFGIILGESCRKKCSKLLMLVLVSY